MEWKLPEDKMKQYDSMLKGAQDLEMTIGSTQYRVHKLLNMRQDLEKHIKEWWDTTAKEMNLEPNGDYVINKDGMVRLVEKEQPQPAPQPKTEEEQASSTPSAAGQQNSNEGTNASELK